MEDFGKTLMDLALADVKPDIGWFTWTNNRRGEGMVRERLDRYVMSFGWFIQHPFFSSNILQQAHFDHNAIQLDTLGRKPMDSIKDPRLRFRFEACYAKDRETKAVIREAWAKGSGDVL